jgi:Protein of unknown function (DUF3102)
MSKNRTLEPDITSAEMDGPSPSLAKITKRIHKLRQSVCNDVIAIGRLLSDAKGQLVHGMWGDWLRAEFAWSQDTAENFMNVYRVFGEGKSEIVSELDVCSLYLLAKPSTPQEARDTVAGLIADDTPPALADVRRIIREAKGIEASPEPERAPQEYPSVRKAALIDQFKTVVEALMSLSTKPANTFAYAVPAHDLDMLGNFLKQIAAASRQAA